MTVSSTTPSPRQTVLRLWPGVLAVTVQWLVRFVLPVIVPEALPVAVFGGLLGGGVVIAWWVFFSGASRLDRWGAAAVMLVSLTITAGLLDRSIATAMMGMMFLVYAVPVLSLALVVWAVGTRGLSHGPRRVTMVATIVLASGLWTLLRTDGMTGSGRNDFAWRWAQTAEQRLLAHAASESGSGAGSAIPHVAAGAVVDAKHRAPTWAGFRGRKRDGVVTGVRIGTDWSTMPPVELWRRAVGPGVSSFAVQGDLVYTQEQRGDAELVAAYRLSTGQPVWQHRDEVRFWDSHAGAGPRGTPTLSGNRVFTFGGTGIVNALDADTGAVVWSRDAATEAGATLPGWGFSSSPLVVDDAVIVAVSGRLMGYDRVTGERRWTGPEGGSAYSSPHRVSIDGVDQVLLASSTGVVSVAPADGSVMWDHAWPAATRIVQPWLTHDGDLLISGGEGSGLRRLGVGRGAGGWTVEERWTSNRLKPYHNDFVVHRGHAYGFDGSILACLDVEDGARRWKGGRYGHGQLLLLPEQDVLLVLSEQGDLVLVEATPERFQELARVPAIEGKTWNHPALAGDVLLIRNAQEMAAFRLPSAGM